MQFLPWAVILLLIYVIYFLMIRYEKKIATLSKMIEQNSDGIKENFTYIKFHIFIVLFFLKAKISIITKKL